MGTVLRQMVGLLDTSIDIVDDTCRYLEAFYKKLDDDSQTERETDDLEACAEKIVANKERFMAVYLEAGILHRSVANAKGAGLGETEAGHVHMIFQTIASYLLLFNISTKDLYARILSLDMMDSRPLRSVRSIVVKCL